MGESKTPYEGEVRGSGGHDLLKGLRGQAGRGEGVLRERKKEGVAQKWRGENRE